MTILSIIFWLVFATIAFAAAVTGYFVLLTNRIAARAERLVPPSGVFVTIDGNRIHYMEAGRGRPILCVHGLSAQLHHFRSTVFDDLSADFRVIALDRPGSGYSTRAPGASARLTEQARVVRRFIDELGLEKPLVVGHSLGGAVSLALAIGHPETISGLALLAPLTRHRDEISPGLKPIHVTSPARRWLLSRTLFVPGALKYAERTLAYIFSPQKPGDDYMIEGGGWLGLRPSHAYATSSDIVALREDMPAVDRRVREIKVPVGVLFGTADTVLEFEVDGASMPGRLPGVDFERLDGIGHMPQFSAKAETLAFIRRMAAKSFPA